ncbi:bifunctional 4-hydroxy-2-oxoglutarate aldolase/2-dehydro-3-deoxy-phosphogluconate aldolase [soil metagenome]
MHETLCRLEQIAVVPAIILNDADHVEPLAEALIEGGLPCAEITLRTPASLEVLKRMEPYSDRLLLGAGTVLNISQADEAIDAGARFIVSPGMDEKLIRHCQDRNILIIPGACTPTEVMMAVNLGLDCVKFFPSHAFGGLPVLRALHGPFPQMRFLPTGGITMESLTDHLGFKPVLAVGGTWMIKPEWLENGRYDLVTEVCTTTMEIVQGARRMR